MYKLNVDRCLVIPDIHQNIEWATEILNREEDNVDHVIFLGDYFDTFRNDLTGVRGTAKFLKYIKDVLKDKVTFLLGNHDVSYMSCRFNSTGYKLEQITYHCTGFTLNKAGEIHKEFNYEFWNNFEFFKVVNDHYMLSHAGLHNSFWRHYYGLNENLKMLDDDLTKFKSWIRIGLPEEILMAGISRGGPMPHGGILWQDWNREFCDNLPIAQIVGHTIGNGARRIGTSYCLDGDQTCYGIIEGIDLIIKNSDGSSHNMT